MALSAKDLDPVRVYSYAPKLWDFVLLLLLLFYTIKKSFITVRAIREHGVGREVTSAIFGAGGGEKQTKQTDNVLAFILAMIMSIGLMRYGNISLEFAFTSGILPFIAAFMLGMGSYSYLSTVPWFREKKTVAAGIGALVALGIFLAFRVAAKGDYQWVYVLVWFLAVLIFVNIVKGSEERAADPSSIVAGVARNVNDAIRGTTGVEGSIAALGKRADELEKSDNAFLEILKDLRASIASGFKDLQAAAAAAALVAGATQMAAASPEATKPAIVRKLVSEGTPRAVADAAADQITIVSEAVPVPPSGLKPGPAPEGVVAEAEVTFEGVSPADVAGSLAPVFKNINEEIEKNRREFGPTSPIKKAAEIFVRNYVEFGIWNSKELYSALTKVGPKPLATSFINDVITKQANIAYDIVHGKAVPKGSVPAKAVPKVAPPAGKAKPPVKDEEQAKRVIKLNLEKLELAQSKLLQQIQSFIKISELLKEIPNYLPQLKKAGDKAQADLSALHEESKKLVKKAESPDFSSMFEYAQSLEGACSTLAATLAGANNTFNDGLKPLSSFLITDERALQNLSGELNTVLLEFKPAIEDMKALSDRIKREGVIEEILVEYGQAFDKVDNLITRIINSIEQHAKDIPETLRTSLEGFIPIIQSYQKSLKYIVPQVQAFKSRWAMINDGIAKIEKENKAVEKAEFTAVLEPDNIKKDSATLSALMTGLIRPGGGPVFAQRDIDFFKNNAVLALQILERLDKERMKIVGLPANTKSTGALGTLLATLKGLRLRNDLADFVSHCEDAIKDKDEKSGAADFNEALKLFQMSDVKGEDYADYVGGLARAIDTAADNVSKEMARPLPAA